MVSAEKDMNDVGQARAAHRLAQFTARWQARRDNFSRWNGNSWWARGSIISPEMRGWYNSFLPIDDYLADLRLLALDFLGDDSLVPSVLHKGSVSFLSLPDFWASLNDNFAGRVCFKADELLELWCNLADPARMGTASGRYMAQLSQVQKIASGKTALRLLDLGCGVGLGTYEATAVCGKRCHQVDSIGVTAEGLEAWMATNRCLPHTRKRERQFPASLPDGARVEFRKGLAEAYSDNTTYDIILCNGLAGGRFLNHTDQFSGLLATFDRMLKPHGNVLLSNHFHEGSRCDVETLMRQAAQRGWLIKGDWQNLSMEK
ncbi:MAG: class I SAM-dependent methyltransferase [Victivallales bacterium]|nr:class I SAM-dependent methyltransferase [Victivallales bacterium]